MAIRLEKGQRINLEKADGKELRQFCVGCNWGAITKKSGGLLGFGGKTIVTDVDLDLSCVVFDAQGKLMDHIYSPHYRADFLSHYGMPPGKLQTLDGAMRHSGDDRKGDVKGDDGLDNEVLTVDLAKINPAADRIFFFLNNVGPEDFARIPYASIRMYEGTPQAVREIYASYDVAAEPAFAGKRALVMGKLYRRNGAWRFAAIGDAVDDAHICDTINRIQREYAK